MKMPRKHSNSASNEAIIMVKGQLDSLRALSIIILDIENYWPTYSPKTAKNMAIFEFMAITWQKMNIVFWKINIAFDKEHPRMSKKHKIIFQALIIAEI
jgi:hypothetical protein